MSLIQSDPNVRTGPSSSVGGGTPPPLEGIVSPAAAMSKGILGNTPTSTVTLAMRLEYAAVKSSPTGEVSKSQGGVTYSFEGNTPEDQALRLMGAVAEWLKSVVGVEVDFQVKDGAE